MTNETILLKEITRQRDILSDVVVKALSKCCEANQNGVRDVMGLGPMLAAALANSSTSPGWENTLNQDEL